MSRKYTSPKSTSSPKSDAFRTTLTINEIRASAWNASMGAVDSYAFLQQENRKLANIANRRLRALEKAGLDMFAYDRAITYLSNHGRSRFSTTLPPSADYKSVVEQLQELVTFINSNTSTVAGARNTLNAKIDMIMKQTGHEYTDEQRTRIGRLIGTDSISTLLREVKGNSDEVIDMIEEMAINDTNLDKITSIIDKHLAGYNPFEDSPFFSNFDYMSYDEMMDELRDLTRGNND